MDKVDAYDKEQLQAMGWLFDEIETPDTAVRFVEQDLTSEQQMQVFKNLGWEVYVTDSKSFLGSTLTPEEIERFKVTSAIILTDLNKIFLYGAQSGDYIRFYGMVNNDQFGGININPSTGLVTGVGSYRFLDVESVHFTKQTLTIPQQNQALGNIGIDFVRLPYSLLGTTLSDGMANVINNARGIILVDTPNDFILPTIYNKGRTTSTNAKFIAIGEVKDVYYFSYNKNTKALAAIVHDYTDNGCVRYVQEQSLTDTQKDTVLSNIGLDFVQVDYSLLGTTLTDEMMEVLDNARGIILVDTPSNFDNPTVFIKGINSPTACYFVSHNTGTTYCQIQLNKSTKILSSVSAGLTYGGSVRYAETQNLTNTQKQQARSNIGVQSADELLADDNFIAQLKTKLGL